MASLAEQSRQENSSDIDDRAQDYPDGQVAQVARKRTRKLAAGGSVRGRAGERREVAASPNNLSKYFNEMAQLSVHEPRQEFAAAREIEELEIAVWQAVFSYPPTVAFMIRVVDAAADKRPTRFDTLLRHSASAKRSSARAARDKLDKAAKKVAAALREHDVDKELLDVVMGEIGHIERNGIARLVPGKLPFRITSRGFDSWVGRVRAAHRSAAKARNDFVRANLRLVVSIARRFNHGRMPLADLIQEGNIGLMKAVERYDYRRGFRFSTYASWWIRHAISRALADKGREVRLPVHMIDAHHKLTRATRELSAKLGRQPTVDELSSATCMSEEKIEKMRSHLFEQSFSLDKPVNDEDGRTFMDYLLDPQAEDHPPEDALTAETMSREVRREMQYLKPIEADILRKRFGFENDEEHTLKEIGAKYNLSRERIRQLQEQALDKMRRALESRNLLE